MNFESLNWADYSIIVVMMISIIISLVRGFVREALSLASWIIAFWVGISFSKYLAVFLSPYISHPTVRIAASFFILFAISLLIGAMVSYLITQIVQKTGLSGTDRMLGIVFGMGRGALVIALLVLITGLSTMPKETWWKASVLIPHFKPMAIWLKDFLPDNLAFNFS